MQSRQTTFPVIAALITSFACLIFTLWVYRPFGLYFLNDDLVHLPLSEAGMLIQRNSFRCVNNILHFAEIKWFGKSAVAFHATCLVIHLLCSWLVFIFSSLFLSLYSKMEGKRIKITALLTAAFFMVYAFHSEAVIWIIGNVSSLAAFFFLLGLICYLKKETHAGWFISSLLFFQVALFTYESTWIFPVVVWLLWWADRKKRSSGRSWIYPALVTFTFLLHLLARKIMLGETADPYEVEHMNNFDIVTLFLNYNRLAARSLLPPMQSVSLFMFCYGLILFFIAWLSIVLIRKQRPHTIIIILLASLLVSFLPVISLGIDTHGTESERYLYLPSVFLSLLVMYLLMNWNVSFLKQATAVSALLIFHAFFAWKSSLNYRLVSSAAEKILADAGTRMQAPGNYAIYNLPAQINKVKVFDMGFKEGMAWLYGKDTIDIKEINKVNLQSDLFRKNAATANDIFMHPAPQIKGMPTSIFISYDSAFGVSRH